MSIINKRGVFEFLTRLQEIKKLKLKNNNLIKTLIKEKEIIMMKTLVKGSSTTTKHAHDISILSSILLGPYKL